MNTKAVRLYGQMDLRMEEFELPEIKEDEILAKVVSDSICMSSYKAASQGADHKRVPNDVAENPVIIGHEFCGKLVKVGAKWADQFKEGDKFTFARIYATATETKLYLPTPHGKKPARVRNPRFSDTPNEITIRSASDILEAYDAIEQVMLSYSFTKYPENSNDLQDVDVPDGNGFAYTIKF